MKRTVEHTELLPFHRTRVEKATVHLKATGGQGVLVPGGLILTATHCIKWSGTGGMALGDVYPTEIETSNGIKFRVGVAACEPVSDIAVLEELDNQEFEDATVFEEWREQVIPVPLSSCQLEIWQSCPVFIFTHKHEWLTGHVTRYGVPWRTAGSSVALFADGLIESGTSGSPVVTGDGQLFGIVSHTWTVDGQQRTGEPCGMLPVVHMALPGWVLAHIAAQLAE